MYDAMWQEAMGDLSEQLNVEGAEDLDDDVNLEEVHEVSCIPIFKLTIFIILIWVIFIVF